jgi:VWFA-related protein
VAKVINGLSATEKLALYSLDVSGLRVICEFGTDRGVLLKRVAVLTGHPSPYLQPASENTASISPGQDAGVGQDQFLYSVTAPASVFAEAEGFIADWTIRSSAHALEAIADHLAGVPPRKGLIWVSYGVPGSIDVPGVAAKIFPNAMKQTRTYSDVIDQALRKLNNADVAVYGVDPGGVWRDMLRSPERVILDEFASRTGGKSWHGNGLDFEIETALNDVDHSYTLGYYAPPDYDRARFHRIKVEVKRPGVKLRYREGYSVDPAVSPAEGRQSRVVQALLSPVDNSTIPITVKAVRRQDSLSLQITLQAESLGLAQKNGRWQGNIDFIARFAADNGTELGTPSSKTVIFNLTQGSYDLVSRSGLNFTKALDIPRGASKLRVLVRDDSNNQIGTLTIPLSRISREQR